MNRPIKFRAWDKIAKMFCQVSWACDIDNDGFLYPAETQPKTDLVIMQFTGLLDKNGKEIFEGDIVKFQKNSVKPMKVVWSDKRVGWSVVSGDGHDFGIKSVHMYPKSFEVIGNIFSNPELLK